VPHANTPSPTARSVFDPLAALQLAIQHHQAGRLPEAEMLYQQVLQVDPNHPDTLHLLGVVNHQLGNNDLAYTLIGKAVKQIPTAAHFINNLGEVCRALNKMDEAQACYEKALAQQPDHAEAHRNLGLVYLAKGYPERAISHLSDGIDRFPDYLGNYWALGLALFNQGENDKAIFHYDKVLAQSPDDPSSLCGKGVALKAKGELNKAIQHYLHAITLQPLIPELHHNLALIYQGLGKLPEAETCFERTLVLQPNNEMAKHLLAGLQNVTPDRAPASYVRDTFDSYADNFDIHLVDHLQYRTPEILAKLICNKLNPEHQTLNVLDLGCGTGLFGEQIKPFKNQLVGIDLSSKMIAKARERKIYDALIVGDLLDYMSTVAVGQFQLIVATDVFIYVGNLLSVFQQASRLLDTDNWFAFSLEAAPDNTNDFVLDKTGRYQHGRTYIHRLCEQYGFKESDFTQATLRKDGNKLVGGYLYLLSKT
jgi:predicted TPR repeat methyltransferase